ncbi:MAG: DUF4922 domain-containing protein [Bacteroidales bacterium]|jgi:hypothetical protein|nr:DUF4922 domain-containing protein [Bacteroidales bacterium]
MAEEKSEKYTWRQLTSDIADALLKKDLETWSVASERFGALAGVSIKRLRVGCFDFKVQYNPARVVSTTAKIDAETLRNRKCFLCREYRQVGQDAVRVICDGGEYDLIVNPFPIFNRHFTIVDDVHVRQHIEGRFIDMVSLAKSLCNHIVFYNGPKCGASAPDHLHFQAGNKGELPLQTDFDKLDRKVFYKTARTRLSYVVNFANGCFILESHCRRDITRVFNLFMSVLPVKKGDWEPMMDILVWFERTDNKRDPNLWRAAVFVRRQLRPSCYTAKGEKHLLVSPASVDFGGIFVTPRKEDFDKITSGDIEKIFSEICITHRQSEDIIKTMKNTHTTKNKNT